MVSFPPCKINLGLRIIRKREDGYHELETCFYPLPWTDILEVVRADKFLFKSSGISIPGKVEDNLCVRAYWSLKNNYDIPPVSIHLHKVIPMGAGLGGGSSDAAYVLRSLNSIFSLKLNEQELMGYASRLGSDCAFFIQDDPMLGLGRGELLQPVSVSLAGKHVLLVKPDIHVSTAEAYGGVTPTVPAIALDTLLKENMSTWRDALRNDFEKTVFSKYPAIGALKEMFYDHGAIYAAMSGSGSTVFGIFDETPSWAAHIDGALYWYNKL